MIRIIILAVFTFVLVMGVCSNVKKNKTTIEVLDNGRHYYPVLAGQDLEIVYKIKNTGKRPLIIKDIVTSCECLELSKSVIRNIPADEEGVVSLTYKSSKNIGYVKHHIILYGNFATGEKLELTFDINVVSDALYTKNYEELFLDENQRWGIIKDPINGDERNKGYYMNAD